MKIENAILLKSVSQRSFLFLLLCFIAFGSNAQVTITFQVNTRDIQVSEEGINLGTSLNGFNPLLPMTNIGDSIYSVTINDAPENTNISYRFANDLVFEAGAQEGCNAGTNRIYNSGITDTTLPAVCFGGLCTNCPTEVAVTFRVNMALEPVTTEGVFITSSLDWENPVEMQLTTEYTYQATLNVPINSTVEYYFLHGDVPENPAQEACSLNNHRFYQTAVSNTTLPVTCYGGYCGNCSTTSEVTFNVNMSSEEISPSGVFLETSAAWDNPIEMTVLAGDVYTVTTSLPNNQSIQYKFKNGELFEGNAQGGCSAGVNRFFTTGVSAINRPIVCFGGLCTDCTNPINYTFQVDVNREEFSDSDTLYIAGSFNNWCYNCDTLINIGEGVWSIDLELSQNSNYEFIYSLGSEESKENLSLDDSCVVSIDNSLYRSIQTITSDSILSEICYGFCTSCDAFPPLAYVTFLLNMSDYAGDYSNGIFISGDFNNWCETCDTLNLIDDGLYGITLRLETGYYSYSYLINQNSDVEIFDEQDDCAFAQDVIITRFVEVLNSDSLRVGPYFWNTCDTISTVGISSLDAEGIEVFPNPFSNGFNLSIPSGINFYSIRIVNTLGEVLFNTSSNQNKANFLSVEFLKPGIYFLQVQSNKGVYTKKIIRR